MNRAQKLARAASRGAAVLCAVAAFGAAVQTAVAIDVYMDNTNTTGESWLNTTDWNPDGAPTISNQYFVDGVTLSAAQVRTPTSGNLNFEGASLTVQKGGSLSIAVSGATVSSLFVKDGGYINNTQDNTTRALNGTITFTGTTGPYTNYIRTAGVGSPRNLTSNSLITGDGTLRLVQRGTITFANTGSTFSGLYISGGSGLTIPGVGGTVTHTATNFTTVAAASLGGSASFTVDTFSSLELTADWTTTGELKLLRDAAQSDTQAPLILHQNLTVNYLTIGATTLDPGVYDFTTLNSTYNDYFRDIGGSGQITVVLPEPGTAALALMSVAMALQYRTRRR